MARSLTLAAVYLLAAASTTFVFVIQPGLTRSWPAHLPRMVDGTADRPFVTRALAPLSIRLVVQALPAPLKRRITARLAISRFVAWLGWDREHLVKYAVACVEFLICFAAFAWTLGQLVYEVYEPPPLFAELAPLLALASLPMFFRYLSYVYDPPTLLLFSLGVLAILRKRFLALLLVLALANLNKETAVLFVGIYAVHEWTTNRRLPVGRTLLLLAICIAARAALWTVYRDNSGSFVEQHVWHTWWLAKTRPAHIWSALGVIVPCTVLVGGRWREKDRFLRWGLAVTLIPLVAAATVIGYVDELRDYYEAYPFVFLLALPTLCRWLGVPCPRRQDAPGASAR